MKYLHKLFLGVCLAALAFIGWDCTATGDVDLDEVATQVELAVEDLLDVAALVEDEGLKEDLLNLAVLADQAAKAMDGAPTDAVSAVEAALFASEALLEATDNKDIQAAIIITRMALRRYLSAIE